MSSHDKPASSIGANVSFSDLVRNHGDAAYNFAFRLAGNESDARDLVQEAFARALKNWNRYDPSKPFGAWLNTILHNIFIDGVKRYEHRHAVSLDAPTSQEESQWEEIIPSKELSPIDELSKKERNDLVQKALDSLPIHYKSAVILCDIENMGYQEISEVLNCPIGTVRSRIHQGRVLLRKAFEKIYTMEGS